MSGRCDDSGQCNIEPGLDADPSAADADEQASACGGRTDDTITRIELPMAAGRSANFRIAQDASVDTRGSESEGERHWNLDLALSGDADREVSLDSLEGRWFADDFPDASYSARLSFASDLLGVFSLTDEGLFLLGVVSPEPGIAQTRLRYEPPALLMPVPLREGDTWSTDSEVSGQAQGIISVYTESYQGEADASGVVTTPYGDFRALRTRTTLTRTLGVFPAQVVTVVRQFNFVAECAGIVASVVSEENESALEFQNASEVRRIIP